MARAWLCCEQAALRHGLRALNRWSQEVGLRYRGAAIVLQVLPVEHKGSEFMAGKVKAENGRVRDLLFEPGLVDTVLIMRVCLCA